MGACASMLSDAPPEGGEVSRLADKLVRLGAERRTVNDALRLFWRADKDGSGTLGLKEFAETFALRTRNAFLPRMMSLFDVGGDGDIGALEFVMCMAQFHEKSASAHIYFAWRLFDQDDSGSMTMEEFETIINNSMSYTGSNEGFSGGSHDHMGDRIVRAGRNGARVRVKGMRQIIKQADLDDNGVITIDEFKVLCANSSHIAAPAFELWSAVEAQSKPCWKLKEELKAKGKLEAVLEMLSPAARKALGVKRKTDVDRKDRRHGAARRTMGNNRRKPERKIPGDLAFMDSVKIKNEDGAARGERQSGERRAGAREHRDHRERSHRHHHRHRDDREHRGPRDDRARDNPRGHRDHHSERRKHRPDDGYYGQPPPNAFAPNQGLGGGYGGNDVRYGGNQMSPSHQYEQQRPPMSNGGGGGYGQPRGGQPPRPGARAPFAGDGDQDELLAQLERDLYGR
uniref:EF-hand domain-containing protein n=1 Tax=Ostreococcus sp. 'lucimarinus' TaxID=242159 RepID=A0A7R9XQJ5_9CHLO|mmetsp:Transcript_2337/g.9192  ORF Transcript_2337/g.9192 Transcript_2337/m.9192 type:complete len:456 (+) Transcript_2337:86-1453(+)